MNNVLYIGVRITPFSYIFLLTFFMYDNIWGIDIVNFLTNRN